MGYYANLRFFLDIRFVSKINTNENDKSTTMFVKKGVKEFMLNFSKLLIISFELMNQYDGRM